MLISGGLLALAITPGGAAIGDDLPVTHTGYLGVVVWYWFGLTVDPIPDVGELFVQETCLLNSCSWDLVFKGTGLAHCSWTEGNMGNADGILNVGVWFDDCRELDWGTQPRVDPIPVCEPFATVLGSDFGAYVVYGSGFCT